MVNDNELATIIARELFKAGALHGQEPERIAYMLGKQPERVGAGWGEAPLADFIAKLLAEHRSY